MGTRSNVSIIDGNREICRIYRQFDGYPEGMGLDLAGLCDRKLTNGIRGGEKPETYVTSNGMRELAAQIVTGLKTASPVGNVYLEEPNSTIGDWIEYIYVITSREGEYPVIECRTHAPDEPAWPFNLQTESKHVFRGTAKEWFQKYKNKAA